MFFLSHFVTTILAWSSFFIAQTIAANVNSSTTTVPLHIMALGASVTFGVGSTTGNSYRKDLEDLLVQSGNQVTFLGSKRNGNFTDNAVEATSGFVIEQISEAAKVDVPMFKPNLVLVDAGTNNCNQGGTVPDAGTNVTNMINDIFTQSPGATVILTTILFNSVAEQDACRVSVNDQYKSLASTMQAIGAKLVLVDMRGSGGPLVTDLADGRHPNDVGYVKMANIWFEGIQEAISKGFLKAPSSNSTSSSTTSTGNTSTSNPTTSMIASETSAAPAMSNKPALSKSPGRPRTENAVLATMLIPLFIAMTWL